MVSFTRRLLKEATPVVQTVATFDTRAAAAFSATNMPLVSAHSHDTRSRQNEHHYFGKNYKSVRYILLGQVSRQ